MAQWRAVLRENPMKQDTIKELMLAADKGSIPALRELGERAASPNQWGLTNIFACKCYLMAAFLGDELARERSSVFMADLSPTIADAIFEEVEDWICDKLEEDDLLEEWSAELLCCRFPLSVVH
jgi:hypothetical protein